MKNFTILIGTCLLCCLPFIILAQADYRSGYLITSQGDSLSGFIRVKETAYTPNEVIFKPTANARETTVFKPDQIKRFEVKGIGKYEAYTGAITMDKINFPDLPTGRDMSTENGIYLLEVMQEGKNVTLYSYTDAVKTRLFLKEKGDVVKELSYKQYFVEADGKKNATKQEYYKAQLWLVAENQQVATSKLQRRINTTSYSAKDLKDIINFLNGLVTEETFEEGKSQHDSRFFVGAGINRNRLLFQGIHPLAENMQQESPLQPILQGGFDFYLSSRTKRLFIRGEVYGTKATYDLNSEILVGSARGNYFYDLDQYLIGIRPQLLYNLYRTTKLRAFAGAGMQGNYHIVQDVNYKRTSPDNTEAIQMHTSSTVTKFSVGFPFRAGIMFNDKLEVSCLYVRAYGTGSMQYRILTENLQVGVNYHFGKRI